MNEKTISELRVDKNTLDKICRETGWDVSADKENVMLQRKGSSFHIALAKNTVIASASLAFVYLSKDPQVACDDKAAFRDLITALVGAVESKEDRKLSERLQKDGISISKEDGRYVLCLSIGEGKEVRIKGEGGEPLQNLLERACAEWEEEEPEENPRNKETAKIISRVAAQHGFDAACEACGGKARIRLTHVMPDAERPFKAEYAADDGASPVEILIGLAAALEDAFHDFYVSKPGDYCAEAEKKCHVGLHALQLAEALRKEAAGQ